MPINVGQIIEMYTQHTSNMTAGTNHTRVAIDFDFSEREMNIKSNLWVF